MCGNLSAGYIYHTNPSSRDFWVYTMPSYHALNVEIGLLHPAGALCFMNFFRHRPKKSKLHTFLVWEKGVVDCSREKKF